MDGDWNLAGCRWNDPSRLKTVQDVVDLIHKVGFLSLFSVEIPGMSVEEHVPASTWWTDDENTDPWCWRMQIAVSIGVAKVRQGTALKDAIEEADQKLYEEKKR